MDGENHNRARWIEQVSYGLRVLPSYAWQRLTRTRPRGRVHLVIALANHFEPAIVPGDGRARAPRAEQQRRVDRWCTQYAKLSDRWRDEDGRGLCHTYFYPAEQYDQGLIERLAEHCQEGCGEIEVHLHHGMDRPDTADNTRQQLIGFRDLLATRHGCLSFWDGAGSPRYAFVHGNFALANSAGGNLCGVDQEMQLLADTGCYADLTLPAAPFHAAQIAKINSLYECSLPLARRAPHRRGRDLRRGHVPATYPLMIQGPLVIELGGPGRFVNIESGAVTRANPMSLRRLELWKRVAIRVAGRPDWLFVKLHCHGMDPTQEESLLGAPMEKFLSQMVEGASQRSEVLHFVSAREMANIILAACDGRQGNPGDYRDYRLKRGRPMADSASSRSANASLRG